MVYTVTLNPALDYVMRCDYVGSEDINRAKSAEILLGGKGINVSVVLSRLGIPTTAIALAAGFTGHELERLVQAEGIETEFVYLEHGTTRINVKLFAQEQFDVNAPGPEVSDKDIEALFAVLDKLEEGDVLVLAGAVPGSCPEDIYERILKRLDGRGIKFVVDTTGEIMGFFPYASVCVVGRTFCSKGGQNMIEPCLCGVATVVGPETQNFRPVMADLLASEALVQVPSASALEPELGRLLGDAEARAALGARAEKAVLARRGAVDRCVAAVRDAIGR